MARRKGGPVYSSRLELLVLIALAIASAVALIAAILLT